MSMRRVMMASFRRHEVLEPRRKSACLALAVGIDCVVLSFSRRQIEISVD
jgi:hypothetical protein